MADDLKDRIRIFLAEETGANNLEEIDDGMDIVNGLKIYGDDVWELMKNFGQKFNVDMNNFRWYHHSEPEGFDLRWIFRKPWWEKKTHVAIRINDLVESAKQMKWDLNYPEEEKEA